MTAAANAQASSSAVCTAGRESNSSPPAIQLATGSTTVIATIAVGSEPRENAVCTWIRPSSVEMHRPTVGHPIRPPTRPCRATLSPVRVRKIALTQKETPAELAVAAALACGMLRSSQPASRSSTISTMAPATTASARPVAGTCWGTLPRSHSTRARPAQMANAAVQSRRIGL
jgi:hypothetical protein